MWRDGSDERADRLVAEMEREGQPWTVPATPVASVPPASVSRWALLEPDETADPEAVVQAWRETILDLTKCSLFDAVLRCADMWGELDRADRRKRMN